MNRIYKTKKDTQSKDLEEKLKAYCQEKVQSSFNSLKSLSKGSLAFLAPLAATGLIATDVNAQACGAGTAMFDPAGGYYSDGQLDVDGDGVPDFDFDVSAGYLFITAVGTMSIGSTFSSYAAYLNTYGAPINGTANFYGSASTSYAFIPVSLNSGTASTIWIPIQQSATGFLGFIEIMIDGVGGYTINTNQTGIATSAGPVDAGVCASIPLPVELLSFDVSTREKKVLLNWATASELNNKGFEIQRSSDGVDFNKVGWVNGEGTAVEKNNYNFVDQNARPNVLYYYRLKQMDFDGKYEFSSIVSAKVVAKEHISIGAVVPNPVSKNEFRIEIGSQVSENLNYEQYDAFGKNILSQIESIAPGLNTITISTVGLTNGTYFLKMNASETSEYRKIIIQK